MTIAKVPVDWPQSRAARRAYLNGLFPELAIPETVRVDEMEALALRHTPDAKDRVCGFRDELESALDDGHEPLPEICECIQRLAQQSENSLFIISNNLYRTVDMGLKQLGLSCS